MITKTCDSCTATIMPDASHYSVDATQGIAEQEAAMESGEIPLLVLSTDAEFHLCSLVCLMAWCGERI